MKHGIVGNVRRTIWASDVLWTEVEAAAKQDDRTVSSWIRDTIVRALESERKWRKDPLFSPDGQDG